jgi:2-phospho-L-lactate guanylyltransferase
MQGTVASFDENTGAGTVVLDDGTTVPFPAAAFAASGLRLLRTGQRVGLVHNPAGQVELVTLIGLMPPPPSDR